jgi:hypothetical protein
MQDQKEVKQEEIRRFIKWTVHNYDKWEEITSTSETDAETLASILKSLRSNELHTLFLTAVKKNSHTVPLCNILENIIWDIMENLTNYEMIRDVENKIIQELEQLTETVKV